MLTVGLPYNKTKSYMIKMSQLNNFKYGERKRQNDTASMW